jgi:hypothetical protein
MTDWIYCVAIFALSERSWEEEVHGLMIPCLRDDGIYGA